MKLTRPFVMVEKDVLFSTELTALEKLVYCVLCAFSDNNTRSCYPSYNTIAEKAGCSKKTAIQCVASLCEKGWMQKMEQWTKKGGHRSNRYFLSLSPEKQNTSPAPIEPEPPSQQKKFDSSSDDEPYWGYTERLEDVKQRIEYDYFAEHMPDQLYMVDFLCQCIPELYDTSFPEDRKLLNKVSSLEIIGFLHHTAGQNYSGVKNMKAYLKTMFLEYLRNEQLLLATAVPPKI
ncbi:helix-turn-helix domain-containing protein [Anaerotignum lactatifermentans]|uniref:helix-turn-helix domain-containing protein n=1 Tax=Anaerotignum lactatifermentans TaxID=160404 RepID=UPI003080F15A